MRRLFALGALLGMVGLLGACELFIDLDSVQWDAGTVAGGADAAGPDASGAPADAAAPADAGAAVDASATVDAGAAVDSGATVDSGASEPDAGVGPGLDAAAQGPDAETAGRDASAPGADGGWSVVCDDPGAALAPATKFTGVWNDGAGKVWVIGEDGSANVYQGTWMVQSPGATSLTRIWGTSPGEIWATASTGEVHRWDGATWDVARTLSGVAPYAIHGTSAQDYWVVASTLGFWHWTGSWSSALRVDGVTVATALWAVFAVATDTAWAVGSDGFIARWNGTTWSSDSFPTAATLLGVWASNPSDVWAVGTGGTILHRDGSTWRALGASENPVAGTAVTLEAVWGSAANDVWAVGGILGTNEGKLLHWNGAAWTVQEPCPGLPYFTDVTTDGTVTWAVGYTQGRSSPTGQVRRLVVQR